MNYLIVAIVSLILTCNQIQAQCPCAQQQLLNKINEATLLAQTAPMNNLMPINAPPASTVLVTDCSPSVCKNLANALQLMIVVNLLQRNSAASSLALQMVSPIIKDVVSSPSLPCGCSNPLSNAPAPGPVQLNTVSPNPVLVGSIPPNTALLNSISGNPALLNSIAPNLAPFNSASPSSLLNSISPNMLQLNAPKYNIAPNLEIPISTLNTLGPYKNNLLNLLGGPINYI